MNHTPGPWTATRDADTRGNPCWRIDAPTVSLVAVLTYPNASARADGIGDARLIAAAPELLAALEFYANAERWKDVDTGIGAQPGDAIDYGATARAAIAKALG